MADAFDALMKSIADEADAKVDYAVMHAAVLQKAAAVRRRRAQFVRYGAMAATLVVLAGVGTLFLQARGDAARSGENAAPQAVEFSMGGQAADMAPEGAPEEPALGCVPESVGVYMRQRVCFTEFIKPVSKAVRVHSIAVILRKHISCINPSIRIAVTQFLLGCFPFTEDLQCFRRQF